MIRALFLSALLGVAALPASAQTADLNAEQISELMSTNRTFRSLAGPYVYRLRTDGSLMIQGEGGRTSEGRWEQRGTQLCIIQGWFISDCFTVRPSSAGRLRFRNTGDGELSEDFAVE